MTSYFSSRTTIHFLVFISGFAALSWQVLWQIKSSLALGVSAWGTALTLAITMGGMCIGSLLMGHALKNRVPARPVRLFGILECLIGLIGLFLDSSFRMIEEIDTWAYTALPNSAAATHVISIIFAVGAATICMGATLPVFGLVARQFKTSIAVLYGLNTLGAAAGTILAAFLLIPLLGISHTIWVIAAFNIGVGISTAFLGMGESITVQIKDLKNRAFQFSLSIACLIVIITGFSTFSLEIAWFRSLTAAFRSTTDAFAIMLASVLIALGVGAWVVPILKKRTEDIGPVLGWSGILILLTAPVIERFDIILFPHTAGLPIFLLVKWFIILLYVIGIPMLLLGIALPWILDDQTTTRRWGALYSLNALAAIFGSICAGWILLPIIGVSKTIWLAGGLLVLTAVFIASQNKKKALAALGISALLIAVIFESGIGRTRTQGWDLKDGIKPVKVLESYEGPDATTSVVEYEDSGRSLIIDGFTATSQTAAGKGDKEVSYMAWMGYLPMLLHPDPKNALVICFGTGQTANAVRNESPQSLDIVDINPRVFKLAHNFSKNEAVLDDPRVKKIVMDGRAYIRRTQKTYDVITLEPMPPNFAGVNALYSKEFYEFAREKLSPDGTIAQWLPFHLVGTYHGASIAKTFQSVFPNAILWVEPIYRTGILIGSKNDAGNLESSWPGLDKPGFSLPLSDNDIKKSVILNRNSLERYGAYGDVIDDNNQLLAYGRAAYNWHRYGYLNNNENMALLDKIVKQAP